jgi:hypothetical protein
MLTKIPIEIVWGDNFPIDGQPASPWPDIEIWQGRYVMAQKFVDLINVNGGHAHMTHGHRRPRQQPFPDGGSEQQGNRRTAGSLAASAGLG